MTYYNLSDFLVQGDADEAQGLWESAQKTQQEFWKKFPDCRCRWQVCNNNRIDRDDRDCRVIAEGH